MSAPSIQMQAALNTVPAGARCVAIFVPTRSIRVLQMDEAGRTFAVEQLQPGGIWRALSRHSGNPWEAYGDAWDAASKAQIKLVGLLRARRRERERAGFAAQTGMKP